MNAGLSNIILKICSWNIEGHHLLLNHPKIKKYLQSFDVIFLCETHALTETRISIPGYKTFDNPCQLCDQRYARGGTVFLVKRYLEKHVIYSDISHNDAIILNLTNGNNICGIYIPPNDSNYFSDHFEYISNLAQITQTNEENLMIIGDENCRLGSLGNLNNHSYTNNPDVLVNSHGKKVINICHDYKLYPVNHLVNNNKVFDGGFTFSREDRKSQIDWAIANGTCLPNIKNFEIDNYCPNISDHKPLLLDYKLDLAIPISSTYDSILNITRNPNNHSNRKNFCKENVDEQIFTTLCQLNINDVDMQQGDNSQLSTSLNEILYKAAKTSFKKCRSDDDTFRLIGEDYKSIKNEMKDSETRRWKSVLNNKDSRKLWNQINWKGELQNNTISSGYQQNDFANILEERSSCPTKETYDDITTNVSNQMLDGDITEEEIKAAVKKMNKNSKSNTGVTIGLLVLVLNHISHILVCLYNNIFHGKKDKYPRNWSSAISCIAKKGHFNLCTFRGITMKDILAKVYDYILMLRLQKWLQIPEQQTAYQKGKGCINHVFFVRCLIAIAKKKGKSLFIGVTDFTSAFDTISRRKLFIKLTKLGIGIIMLNALKAMYRDTMAYVSFEGEYSDMFQLNAGVLQGAATSTLLFIAYTSDIITLFNTSFATEIYIHTYHLLLHADDSLILATTKNLLIEKYNALENYCIDNLLHLQPKKCGFIVINSDEKESIKLHKGNIELLNEITYLGSKISAVGNINQDIRMEIDSNRKHFNKFYAFINKNFNAPFSVKEKVLESCLRSAILYNCEAWGDANVRALETKYTAAVKYMLGVRKQTCNEFIYIELGITTLKSMILKRQYRFYKNIISERDWPMLRHMVCQSRDAKTAFIKYYDQLLQKYKYEEDIITDEAQRIKADVIKKANNGKSRYQAYLKNNPSLKRSHVYTQYLSTTKLQMVTKMRTISHSLEIELGRHGRQRKPVEERLCHCGQIETEEHFLLSCSSYIHVRQKYNITNDDTLVMVFERTDVAEYIYDVNKVRSLYK